MREYVNSAILSREPSAIVETRQYDGGQFFTVSLRGREARVSADWFDNPETVVAILLDKLGLDAPALAK